MSTTATVGVGVDHGELDAGFRLDARRSWLGQGDGEDGAVAQGMATDRHHGAVDQHPAAGDQPGGHGARDVGQHGHGPVDPHPGQEGWDLDDQRAFGLAHALEATVLPEEQRRHQDDDSHGDAGVGHIEGGPVAQRDEVGHQPMMPAHHPLAQVPHPSPEDQSPADGLGRGAHAGHEDGEDHHADGEHHRDQGGPAGERAEGQPRVELQGQPEGSPHVDHAVEVVLRPASW